MIVIEVKAVLLREGDVFVAQCLDHDLAAQGGTADRALYRLGFSLVSNFTSALKRNQEPFWSIKRAPKPYWDLFEGASHSVTRRESMPGVEWLPFEIATSITYAAVEWPEPPGGDGAKNASAENDGLG